MKLRFRDFLFFTFLLAIETMAKSQTIVSNDTAFINSLNTQASTLIRANPDSAILIASKADSLSRKSNYTKGHALANNFLGAAYYTKGDYQKGLAHYLKSLNLFELINDKSGIAREYNNIGGIYYSQHNYKKALEYFRKSLEVKIQTADKKGIAASLNNIGNVYYSQNKNDSALYYRLRALKIYETLDDDLGISATLNNIGLLYDEMGNITQALNYYEKALLIKEKINEMNGVAMLYTNIGIVLAKNKEYEKSNSSLQKALKIASEIGAEPEKREAYLQLARNNFYTNNFKEAYQLMEKYKILNDKITNEEVTLQMAEMQAKYDNEKKENQIQLLNKDKILQASEIKKQKIILILTIIAVFLSVFFSTFIYKSLKKQRKANLIISSQKEVVEMQKQLVDNKQKEITDSITYAKRLQNAILPPVNLIKQALPDSFILYKPKDIIAGDFYWFEQNADLIYLAAADCTGHGVPGAMVSIVCSNALNKAVKEFGITETGKILDKATDIVLETFVKSGEEIKDGMDISLLSIDTKNHKVYWSGANNSLWYIEDATIGENNKLHVVKPDKQPVGKSDYRKNFTTHEFELKKGTIFYLITDGYADQFGGPNKKKFKYKQLEESIISICNLPLNEQEQYLHKTFEHWKGILEQVDDVTIIGIKI